MSEKLKQYNDECEAWQRSVDFLQLENIYMKGRVGEVIKSHPDKSLLNRFEQFQNSFVTKDAVIALFRKDIAEHERFINTTQGLNGNGKILLKTQDKLRHDIEKMEQDFSRLKTEFNNFLAEVLI